MDESTVWFGRAFCTVGKERSEYVAGYRSAIFTFSCLASTVLDCVAMVIEEASENELHVKGFEYLMQKEYMDREPSSYEIELEEQLPSYPVQFKNVHFALADT